MAKFAGDVICSVLRQRSLRAFASLPSAFFALKQRVPADGATKQTGACEAKLPCHLASPGRRPLCVYQPCPRKARFRGGGVS